MALKVTRKTKAIMPDHVFGHCAEMDQMNAAAVTAAVREDAAQAIGAENRGVQDGALGRRG